MGNFYTNVTLRTPYRDPVLAYMTEQGRSCFISPHLRGFVTVYDRICDEQDIRDLEDLTLELSKRFQCHALAVLNHDDDVLWMGLASSGSWVTVYRTDKVLSGSAWRISAAFKVLGMLPLVWFLMRWPVVLFQLWRHSLIVWTLGLPKYSVGYGYEYLSRGERPSGDDAGEFLRT